MVSLSSCLGICVLFSHFLPGKMRWLSPSFPCLSHRTFPFNSCIFTLIFLSILFSSSSSHPFTLLFLFHCFPPLHFQEQRSTFLFFYYPHCLDYFHRIPHLISLYTSAYTYIEVLLTCQKVKKWECGVEREGERREKDGTSTWIIDII